MDMEGGNLLAVVVVVASCYHIPFEDTVLDREEVVAMTAAVVAAAAPLPPAVDKLPVDVALVVEYNMVPLPSGSNVQTFAEEAFAAASVAFAMAPWGDTEETLHLPWQVGEVKVLVLQGTVP